LLYSNATGYMRIGGSDTDETLYTATTCAAFNFTKSTHQYFVASDSVAKESHLIEATSFKTESSVDKVTFKDAASENKYPDKRDGDVFQVGDVTITVGAVDKTAEVVRVTVGGNAVCNKLYTPEGLTVNVPVSGTAMTTNGIISLNGTVTSFNLVFREEDKDENLDSGAAFVIPVSADTANSGRVSVGTVANITNYEIGDTDKYEGYVRSELATKIIYDTSPDQDTATLTYHGEEAYGNLYVSSTGTTFKKSDASSGTATQVVKIEVGATQLASKVAGRETTENMIVVGGPCVNTAAAVIMGNPENCAADFTAGKAMIKLYEHDSGKVALLVAGYSAQDTTAASQVVANYDSYTEEFTGMELEVSDTSSSTPMVGVPTVMEAEEVVEDAVEPVADAE
ncbi:hypothetical protein ACFLYT_01410, partial [Nanoarchaeota archaeon]